MDLQYILIERTSLYTMVHDGLYNPTNLKVAKNTVYNQHEHPLAKHLSFQSGYTNLLAYT